MVSPNHINYWNYLETVTANRNKEAISRLGTESQVKLNTAQEPVYAATVNKIVADTALSRANTQSTLANIDFSQRMTNNAEADLKFQIEKFAKEYILNEADTKTRQDNIKLGYDKMIQDLGITDKNRNAQVTGIWVGVLNALIGAGAKIVGTMLSGD